MERATIGDRTRSRKFEATKRPLHQRLWRMELARGAITIAFGLLFLAARSFAPRLFIYCLGAYLVIDGLLELYALHKRKSITRSNVLDYGGGVASFLAGLLCLVLPNLTLFLLALIVGVRIIAGSFSQVHHARRSRGIYAVLLWVNSGLFVVLGLFLLIFPLLAITFLVELLGLYMLVAGFILLLRGLLLRFTSGSFPVSRPTASSAPPGLSDDLSPTTRRAVVFVRRTAANGLGHIAWAFEWTNGWFNVGSVENLASKLFVSPAEMGFWSTHTLDPVATMQKREYPYDEYKLFFVSQPRPKAAWKTVIWESQEPYSFVHHNCSDVAYEILRAYGCEELFDPAKEYVPNDWFDAIPGASYSIETFPIIPISLHRQSRREIAIREIALAIPPQMKGWPPPWLSHRWRAWEELTLVWEMMVGHIQTISTSIIKHVAQRTHTFHGDGNKIK